MSACLSPIRVWNQQRFLVTSNGDSLYNYVRCGNCATCMQSKAAEYAFRAYKQFEDCIDRNGYVLFDTLTYRNQDVPRFSSVAGFELLPRNLDYMCFSRRDVRLFLVRLRKRLSNLGFKSEAFSMFISSEYGVDDRYTHRPHYHCLFFVYVDIDPIEFSRLVSSCWNKGRTDGYPYKAKEYVNTNVFRSMAVGGRRVCSYVTKYVQKSSAFEKVIKKRIEYVVSLKFGFDKNRMESDEARKMKRDLRRQVCQFHRQSHFFGYSAIRDMSDCDVEQLFKVGFFKMPNGKPTMFTRIPVSTYFLRKLCYEKITLDDGFECWSPRADKLHLLDLRKQNMYDNYATNFACNSHSVGFEFDDIDNVVDYILNKRGRFPAATNKILTIGDRLDGADLFVYASPSDKAAIGARVISDRYIGYKDNYNMDGAQLIPIKDYITCVQSNEALDMDISKMEMMLSVMNDDRQKQFDKIQRINELKVYR